jgi:general secretion pathway protein B
MSFILNALKKSEKERQLRENPHLHDVRSTPAFLRRKQLHAHRKRKVFFVLGLVVIISGCIFYVLGSNVENWKFQKMKEPSIAGSLPAVVEKEEVQVQKRSLSSSDVIFQEELERKGIPDVSSKFLVSAQKKNEERHEPAPNKAYDDVKHTITVNKEILFIRSLAERQNEVPLPDMKNLPVVTQDALPKLHFAGHTYSTDPKKRMIIINNNILREGQKIDKNLQLIEITRNGVVLEFNGRKFKKNF